MIRIREFFIRAKGFFGASRSEEDLERELHFHLEMEARENRRRGLSAEDALRQARIRLGGIEQVKQDFRQQRSLPFIEERLQDLRFACRSLRRSPIFALTVILVGALGIGASTAIFSVVNQTLLAPLPYPEPERLGVIVWDYDGGYLPNHNRMMWRNLKDYFEGGDLAAMGGSSGGNLIIGSDAHYIRTAQVSADYFRILGIPPQLGRSFTATEDSRGGKQAIVLSFRLWRDLLARDPEALGREVQLGGESHTLVGIMPAGFRTIPQVDAWVPLRADSNQQGSGYNYQILTRRRIGSETADQQLLAISTNLGREWAENNGFLRFRIEPYQTELTGTLRPALLLVSGAVGLVLLLAIANVSGLLLARASTRRSEIATRVALGGSRGRIIRQLLTESLLLGLLAGVGGVLLGALLLRILPGLTPLQLGLNQSLTLSWPVLAFALLISGSSDLLFGCAPAWQAAGQNTAATSQSGGSRGTTRASGRFRQALVISEVAMCVILLMVAGLLLRTMVNLRAVEPGFDPRNVLTAQMSMQGSHLESAEGMTAFYQAALERIRSQPGVEGAAVSNNLPVERGMNLPLEINLAEGRGIKSVDWRYVSPDFFQTLGIPLHEGRLFEESDTRSSLPVMIVNRAFRDAYFSGREVEQQRIGVYPFTSEIAEPERVVIGVVENVKGQGLAAPPLPTVYVPVDQVTTELVDQTAGWGSR